MEENYKSTHALHNKNITAIINKKLLRLKELFATTTTNSVADLKAETNFQQEILQASAAETIKNCTNITTDFSHKNTTLVKNLTANVHKEEISGIKNHNEKWSLLNDNMHITYNQLVNTNTTF